VLMNRVLILLTIPTLVLSVAHAAVAQDVRLAPSAIAHCDSAASIARSRQLSLRTRRAWRELRSCGAAGARAMASVIDDSHSLTDIAVLTEESDVITGWRDASLFGSAMRLSLDRSATDESRVFSIRYLLSILSPVSTMSYAELTVGMDSTTEANGEKSYTVGCNPDFRTDNTDVSDAPPPSDYKTQIRSLLRRLATVQSTPRRVQNAAGCVNTVP